MAKNIWKKHQGLEDSILLFLKENPNKTTNQIFENIKIDFPKICWDTVKRQLDELYSEKKVKKMDLERMSVWS